MISRNGVPTASDRDEGTRVRDDRHLRDIQDLIAKLENINRQLSLPVQRMRTKRAAGTAGTSTGTTGPGDTTAAAPAAPDGD